MHVRDVTPFWNDTLPDTRRRLVEARLEHRRRQLARLQGEIEGAPGAIARTLLDAQATAVRRVIVELETELAAI